MATTRLSTNSTNSATDYTDQLCVICGLLFMSALVQFCRPRAMRITAAQYTFGPVSCGFIVVPTFTSVLVLLIRLHGDEQRFRKARIGRRRVCPFEYAFTQIA